MNVQKIRELQMYFDGLGLAQKKEFIENFKRQLAEKGTTYEYSAFLQKCIHRYNSELLAHNSRNNTSVSNVYVQSPPPPPSRVVVNQYSPPQNYNNPYANTYANTYAPDPYAAYKRIDVLSLVLVIVGSALLIPGPNLLLPFIFTHLFFAMFGISFNVLIGVVFVCYAIILTLTILGLVTAIKRKHTHKTMAAFIIGIVGTSLGGILLMVDIVTLL